MIDLGDLLKCLKKVDKQLVRPLTIVAVGGTALVLMGLKESEAI